MPLLMHHFLELAPIPQLLTETHYRVSLDCQRKSSRVYRKWSQKKPYRPWPTGDIMIFVQSPPWPAPNNNPTDTNNPRGIFWGLIFCLSFALACIWAATVLRRICKLLQRRIWSTSLSHTNQFNTAYLTGPQCIPAASMGKESNHILEVNNDT